METKTLVIRVGERHTIRAIAFPAADRKRDRCPTLQFLEEQNARDPAEFDKLDALLWQTARSGMVRNPTRFKHLTGTEGLYEFKTAGGLRLFCFLDEGSLIVCTHGTVKKSQKTPASEIERAELLQKRYLRAKAEGNLIHVP